MDDIAHQIIVCNLSHFFQEEKSWYKKIIYFDWQIQYADMIIEEKYTQKNNFHFRYPWISPISLAAHKVKHSWTFSIVTWNYPPKSLTYYHNTSLFLHRSLLIFYRWCNARNTKLHCTVVTSFLHLLIGITYSGRGSFIGTIGHEWIIVKLRPIWENYRYQLKRPK